ncbi:MAG: hypothetical protein ACRDND_29985, partial [Streptosporangiaceae bacterium]
VRGGDPPGSPRSPLRAERRLGEHPPAAGPASPARARVPPRWIPRSPLGAEHASARAALQAWH